MSHCASHSRFSAVRRQRRVSFAPNAPENPYSASTKAVSPLAKAAKHVHFSSRPRAAEKMSHQPQPAWQSRPLMGRSKQARTGPQR